MKNNLEDRISSIADGKLSTKQIEDLIHFLRQTMTSSADCQDESFFKNLAYEMTGEVKELALTIIDFRRDIKSKIHPGLTEIATKYIPQATDQLEDIIDTTEMAANKIMDNLETMEGGINKMKDVFASLKDGIITVPEGKKEIDNQTIKTLSPLIDYIDSSIKNYMSLISDSFIQMSFQDLTGQRIKRIINLVREMERKVKRMVISFGIKLTERDKNPDISKEDLERAVKAKVSELNGPQKEGQGLDQAGIDELLATL